MATRRKHLDRRREGAAGQPNGGGNGARRGARAAAREVVAPGMVLLLEGNQPPQLNPLMDLWAHPGRPVLFLATANDPDGDALTFRLLSGPPGAALDAAGNFNWTPAWNQLGPQTVCVMVTDPGGLSDTASCTITVDNQAPVLNPLFDQAAHPGVPVNFLAFANDPDGDPVTFTLVNPPAGATITAQGNFTWTPAWSQVGAQTVTIKVTDPGGLSDTRCCTITVVNQAPVLNPLFDLDAHPGVPVQFMAMANDPDGDPLTFSLVNPPPGATITAQGNFTWTPAWSQVGAQTITVKVTDPGGLSDTRSCTITVGNQAPTLNPLPDLQTRVGQMVMFNALANDPDGDALTFSLINPPPGAAITPQGNFSWMPTAAQVGAQTIVVKVSDPGGLSDVRSCTITVNP